MSKKRKVNLSITLPDDIKQFIVQTAKDSNLSQAETTTRLLILGIEYCNILNNSNKEGEKKDVEC